MRELDLHVEEYEDVYRKTFTATGQGSTPSPCEVEEVSPDRSKSDADSRTATGSWETGSCDVESEHEAIEPYHRFWVEYWQVRMMEILR